MSKILQTPSSRQNKFIIPLSNLIKESLWLESDFLKHSKYFDNVFADHRRPEKPE